MATRTQARKRPLPNRRGYGREFGQGKQQEDGVSGFQYPEREMIRQRGQWVSADPKDGSYDEPDDY